VQSRYPNLHKPHRYPEPRSQPSLQTTAREEYPGVVLTILGGCGDCGRKCRCRERSSSCWRCGCLDFANCRGLGTPEVLVSPAAARYGPCTLLQMAGVTHENLHSTCAEPLEKAAQRHVFFDRRRMGTAAAAGPRVRDSSTYILDSTAERCSRSMELTKGP
jgi:hypothetical protein